MFSRNILMKEMPDLYIANHKWHGRKWKKKEQAGTASHVHSLKIAKMATQLTCKFSALCQNPAAFVVEISRVLTCRTKFEASQWPKLFSVLSIKARVSHIQGKCSINERCHLSLHRTSSERGNKIGRPQFFQFQNILQGYRNQDIGCWHKGCTIVGR